MVDEVKTLDEMIEKLLEEGEPTPDKLWLLVHLFDLDGIVEAMTRKVQLDAVHKAMGITVEADPVSVFAYAIIKLIHFGKLEREGDER